VDLIIEQLGFGKPLRTPQSPTVDEAGDNVWITTTFAVESGLNRLLVLLDFPSTKEACG
jgi:hypothetical protein